MFIPSAVRALSCLRVIPLFHLFLLSIIIYAGRSRLVDRAFTTDMGFCFWGGMEWTTSYLSPTYYILYTIVCGWLLCEGGKSNDIEQKSLSISIICCLSLNCGRTEVLSYPPARFRENSCSATFDSLRGSSNGFDSTLDAKYVNNVSYFR